MTNCRGDRCATGKTCANWLNPIELLVLRLNAGWSVDEIAAKDSTSW